MTTALVAQHEVEEEIAVLRGEKESEREECLIGQEADVMSFVL